MEMVRFEADLQSWRKLGGQEPQKLYPITSDWDAPAGSASGHYFHQDLVVAQAVFRDNPARHLDVGSSIEGFVAHVASFRELDVLDIRPLSSTHSNINFIQAAINDFSPGTLYDSVSCLHTLEHFGLGRYGDPIDPNGHVLGLAKLLSFLRPGGTLYVSFPIAGSSRIEFNAHRVFEPSEILTWVSSLADLQKFHYVDDSGQLVENVSLKDFTCSLDYGCGIYTFKKNRLETESAIGRPPS